MESSIETRISNKYHVKLRNAKRTFDKEMEKVKDQYMKLRRDQRFALKINGKLS